MNRHITTAVTRACSIAALLAVVAAPAAAQAEKESKFGITDNSFLVEEAFNQEEGVFQNIFVMARSQTGDWNGSFTQEWPIGNIRHQFSVTAPFAVSGGAPAVGDGLINYRFQAWSGEGRRPAFSPRLSLVLPTSADRRGLGGRGLGWQMNLPFSKQSGPIFFHWNVGMTSVRDTEQSSTWLNTPAVGGSIIVAVRPMLNVMFETYSESRPGDVGREVNTTFAPGVRTGWNVGDTQWVIGMAVPITRGAIHDVGVLSYLSYELPFRAIASPK